MTKRELRSYFLSKRLLLSEQEFENHSAQLTTRLFNSIKEQKAKQVLLFLPITSKKEFYCRPLAQLLWNEGITTALPIADFSSHQMHFAKYDANTDLTEKKFGIIEPLHPELINSFDSTCVIVPLLAHNKNKFRVGYGGGFYDRFFAQHPDIYKLGVSFFGAVERIDDLDEFDVALDDVVFPNN